MRTDRKHDRSLVLRLGLELLVVFVGVYAAFALEAWRERRVADERRAQFQAALAREIRDIVGNTGRAAAWSADLVAFYDSAFAAGGTPSLAPLVEPVRVRAHMWEATMVSGGLDLLDVRTIYEISQFYNVLNAGFEQLAQLRALSETLLIPNLGTGTAEFYEAPGRLHPKYDWYLAGLRRLNALAVSITDAGEALVTEWDAPAAARSPAPEP